MQMTPERCQRCDGQKVISKNVWVFNYYKYYYNPGKKACIPKTVTCPKCKGTGTMYYVTAEKNLKYKIMGLLGEFFGEKAKIDSDNNGGIKVTVKEDAGFKDEEKRLSEEDRARHMIGGGLTVGMDGKKFLIQVKEIE